MHFKNLKLGLSFLFVIIFANSCSSGADPEDIIDDVFTVPAENCLQIQNLLNDMAMDVNSIVMNNIETNKDTIDDEIASCVTPVIHRTNSSIDSIVIDYGTKTCSSNGGNFKGKMIVVPTDSELQNFNIQLSGFYANGLNVTGAFNFILTGSKAGLDFSVASNSIEFRVTDDNDSTYTYSVPTFNSAYSFIKSEEGDIDYVDDVFNFTTELEVINPDGSQMTLISDTGLTYAYTCKNIIGGDAIFTLQDIGEGKIDFGKGDTVADCDSNVSVAAKGVVITVSL